MICAAPGPWDPKWCPVPPLRLQKGSPCLQKGPYGNGPPCEEYDKKRSRWLQLDVLKGTISRRPSGIFQCGIFCEHFNSYVRVDVLLTSPRLGGNTYGGDTLCWLKIIDMTGSLLLAGYWLAPLAKTVKMFKEQIFRMVLAWCVKSEWTLWEHFAPTQYL